MALDLVRVQVAKSELQSVADAAARYAVRGMQTSSTAMTTARAHAGAVTAESKVDGSAPSVTSSEVVRGTFDAATRTFTPDNTGSALSVTIRQQLGRTGSAPLLVSMLRPRQQISIAATAIAQTVNTTTLIQPPASGNLWLSGMPDNTQFQNFRPTASWVWDNSGTAATGAAAKQRPLELNLASLGMTPGTILSLEGISGTATFDGTGSNSADGAANLAANGTYPATTVPTNNANGMSNVRAPIGAVMAVFLSDAAPNSTSAPSNLDFGTAASRDYVSVSPLLKQVFFVGDGKRTSGEAQSIVIPAGATRVFVGMMDAWQWNDNVGNFQTNLYGRGVVQLVR